MIDINVLASGSKGNCYHITDSRAPLLLECGIRFAEIKQGLNFQVSGIEGCLVSHGHQDHCKAVKDIMKAGIDCYMLKATAEATGASGHRVKLIEPLKQFVIGSWTVLPFDTKHDVDSVGFLLANTAGDKLVYLTDTAYCKYRFNGLTHILVEANFCEDILKENVRNGIIESAMKSRLIKTHFSLQNVKEFLEANDLKKVEEIHLLHLSDNNSDEDRFKKEIQRLTGKVVYI